MKIKLEFATDDVHNYPLGYVIIAENEDEEKLLTMLRNMYFFGYIKYAGCVDSDYGIKKLMFENPRTIEKCLQGFLKGSICKDHAINITRNRDGFAPKLTFAQFREVMELQLEIID